MRESKIQGRFMAKGKDARVRVILECTRCLRKVGFLLLVFSLDSMAGFPDRLLKKIDTPSRLELRKFCPRKNGE